MSIDVLQEKIRKLKCPIVLDLSVETDHIPQCVLEAANDSAVAVFCKTLMAGLKGIIPAVRFSFDYFALLGCKGLDALRELIEEAHCLGYYVLLDGPTVCITLQCFKTSDKALLKCSRVKHKVQHKSGYWNDKHEKEPRYLIIGIVVRGDNAYNTKYFSRPCRKVKIRNEIAKGTHDTDNRKNLEKCDKDGYNIAHGNIVVLPLYLFLTVKIAVFSFH